MNSHQQAHEAYVHTLINQRHSDAAMAEQIRLARIGHPSRLASLVNAFRLSIGGRLISAGERLRHAPVEATPSTVLKRSM